MNLSKYDANVANAMNLTVKLITNNKKYNEYNNNPSTIKFRCIFAWLVFTV